jgi:hypothetical protein
LGPVTAMPRELKSASSVSAMRKVTRLVNELVHLLPHQNRPRSHRRSLSALMALVLGPMLLVLTGWAEDCIARYKMIGPADHH